VGVSLEQIVLKPANGQIQTNSGGSGFMNIFQPGKAYFMFTFGGINISSACNNGHNFAAFI
jgi:hypothetical protein